jgi:hypothetical protein
VLRKVLLILYVTQKTDAEKLAGKRIGRLCKILLAVMAWTVLPYMAATAPDWNGRSLWGVVLPIPRLVPNAPRQEGGGWAGAGTWLPDVSLGCQRPV